MGSMPSVFNRSLVASCHSFVIVRGGGGTTKILVDGCRGTYGIDVIPRIERRI